MIIVAWVCVLCTLSLFQLLATPWTIILQAPVSMGFSRQEYWCGLPFPSPRDLPNQWLRPIYLTYPALAGGFLTTSVTWEVKLQLALGLGLELISQNRKTETLLLGLSVFTRKNNKYIFGK